jgi:hypothetical protein
MSSQNHAWQNPNEEGVTVTGHYDLLIQFTFYKVSLHLILSLIMFNFFPSSIQKKKKMHTNLQYFKKTYF